MVSDDSTGGLKQPTDREDSSSSIYSYDENNVPRNQDEECCCSYVPKRYLVATLAFFGFLNVYALRVNLSVAIVSMANSKMIRLPNGTEVVDEPSEFDWDPKLQGFLLSSFFYGYIFTQIPGGYLASRYGGKNLFGLGILVTALLTLITPPVARTSPYLFALVRIVEGLFEGVTFPANHAVWSKWAPPLERSKLLTISMSGPFAGTVIGMAGSGLIAEHYGWEWVFYVFGLIGVIWSVFWFALVTDSPKDHPKISREELKYITSCLADDDRQIRSTPWSSILLSRSVWAIIFAHMAENWGWYTLLTQLPTYLKKLLHFTVQEAGLISSLPYLAMVIIVQFGGQLADFLRAKQILSTTAVRKIFNSVGFISQAVFLIVVGLTTNKDVAIVGLTMAVGLGGFTWSGFPCNILDIAPRYAGIVMGFSNCMATIPGIVSPLITGAITTQQTQKQWLIVFLIAAGFYAVGLILYLLMASGEKEPWADADNDDEAEEVSPLIPNDDTK